MLLSGNNFLTSFQRDNLKTESKNASKNCTAYLHIICEWLYCITTHYKQIEAINWGDTATETSHTHRRRYILCHQWWLHQHVNIIWNVLSHWELSPVKKSYHHQSSHSLQQKLNSTNTTQRNAPYVDPSFVRADQKSNNFWQIWPKHCHGFLGRFVDFGTSVCSLFTLQW